ncbi:hypothetical protein GCM10010295_43370 [Streptomyces intermedius]
MKRLTPHHAVCEEVPRRGPAPPTHRRNREPQARPAFEAISDPQGQDGQPETKTSPTAADPSPAGA